MNNYQILSFLALIGGFLFLLIGALTGEIEVGFFLIFPFFIGKGIFAFIGFIFIIIAILLFLFGLYSQTSGYFNSEFDDFNDSKTKSKIKTGGIILIGPIPIIFGSNNRIFILLLIFLILFIIFLILTFMIL